MRNLKIYILACLSVLMFSCEDNEFPIFDSSAAGTDAGLGIIGFSRTDYNFDVVENTIDTMFVLPVEVSNLSDMDRTFEVDLLDNSFPNQNNFSIPDNVTIPANSYVGEFVIEFSDVDLDLVPQRLVFELADNENDRFNIVRQEVSVVITQVCPVPEDYFKGEYSIFAISASPFGAGNPYFFPGNVTVTGTGLTRRFDAVTLVGGNVLTSELRLICGSISYSTLGIGFNCGGGAISYNPSSSPSPFSLADDSSFIVNFRFIGGCGDLDNQLFLLTKI